MTTKIGALSVDLSAASAAFASDLQKARGALSSASAAMNRTLATLDKGFGSVTGALGNAVGGVFSLRGALAGLAGVAGIGGLSFMVQSSIEAADAIAKMSDKTGIGIESLQELQYAAKLAGVEQDAFGTAVIRFNRSVAEAADGTAEQSDAFRQLGIEIRNADGSLRGTEELFGEVADAMAGMDDSARKTQAAMALFGRAGAELLPLFKDGSAGINELRAEAQRLGLVLDSVMVRQAEQAGDQLERVGMILRTNVTRAVLALSPTIIQLGRAFAEAAPGIAKWINSKLPDSVASVEVLRARLDEVEQQFRRLTGFAVQDVAVQGGATLEEMFGSAAGEARNLIVRMVELNDQIRERAAQENALRVTIEGSGAADAERARKLDEIARALQFERDQLTRSAGEQRLYVLAKQAGIEANADFAASLPDNIKALVAEIDTLKRASAAAKEHEEIVRERMQIAQKIYDETRTPLERYNDQIELLNDQMEAGTIDAELYGRAVRKAQDDLDKSSESAKSLRDAAKDLGLTFSSAFEDAIVKGERFGDVLRGLAQDILRIATRVLVTEPLGGLFKSGLTAILPDLFRAEGGPVAAGRPYIVGERGPEFFVPGMSGQVVPMGDIGGPAGGGNTYNIYAPGADVGAVARIEAALQRLAGPGVVERRAVDGVVAARRNRPGLFE